MKEYKEHIWIDTNKDGTVCVGLTQNFIETKLQECFHIMQADAQYLKKDGPMLVVETNDGLSSLKSPVTGRIIGFNDRARNFPDKLKEEDAILTILPDGVKLPATKVKEKPAEAIQQFDLNWLNEPPIPWPVQQPNNQELPQRFVNIVNRNARRPR